jgi:hypothetical protein
MTMAKKILGAAALTAALAGGGALGALLGAPTLTAAQEEGTTTTAPATDDSTTTTPEATDDGTTTTTPDSGSATEEGDTAEKDCGDGAGRFGGRGIGADLSVAAEALGMTDEELRDALRDGSSIASLAEERGVDVQTVIDALVASATARIDEKVASGDLDSARADELKAELPERIQALVEREGGLHMGGHHGRGPRGGVPGDGESEGDSAEGEQGS